MYEKYNSYKDSGVEWLGMVPFGWETKRMKFLFRDVSVKNRPEAELLSVTQTQGVVPRTWVENRMVMPSGNLEIFKFIEKGDFAISLRSFEGGLEYCYHDGIISPAYTVLKKTLPLQDEYYKYLFKSKSFISEMQTSIVGIREGKNISYPELSYSLIPIPPLSEQTSIASFLDKKTSQIDHAIELKEKTIALLKEHKQIMIQELVTGKWKMENGELKIRDKAKMKDSGVEWIGMVPESWEVKRLGVLGSFSKGGGFSRAHLTESGVPAILYGDIYTRYEYKIDNIDRFISAKTAERTVQVYKGDLLLTGSGETKEDIGKCVALNTDGNVYAGGDIIIFKQKAHNYLFLSYFLNTQMVRDQKAKTSKGEIIVHTYASILKEIHICLPPLNEQQSIVNYIETESSKIDNAISLQEQEIEKLKELKATLIDSAVTGKIKIVDN